MRVKECEGKHGVAKIFAKASWRAARKPALLFWETGRHSKSSGADYGLRVHKRVCAHINTHQQIWRSTQTSYHELYVLYIYIPPTCLHTHAVISDVPQGAGLCRVATLWAPFGVHMKRHNQSGQAKLWLRIILILPIISPLGSGDKDQPGRLHACLSLWQCRLKAVDSICSPYVHREYIYLALYARTLDYNSSEAQLLTLCMRGSYQWFCIFYAIYFASQLIVLEIWSYFISLTRQPVVTISV